MINDQITARLYVFIRENVKGGCKKFSLGDKCECPLCDLDRLLDASNQGASMSQHTELIARLRVLAKNIADAGVNGFGNECSDIADALQAMERVPMTTATMVNVVKAAGWPADVTDRQLIAAFNLIEATEAHHGIRPPESKG